MINFIHKSQSSTEQRVRIKKSVRSFLKCLQKTSRRFLRNHFTEKYRGVVNYKCKLQFKKPKFTPVIIHNLAGYDSHLFIKNLDNIRGNYFFSRYISE